MQAFLPLGTNVTALAASADFAQDGTLYAATNRGLYISTDRGASWALLADGLGAGLGERLLVAVLPGAAGALTAVEFGGTVWQMKGKG
jgi:hypothetical protein